MTCRWCANDATNGTFCALCAVKHNNDTKRHRAKRLRREAKEKAYSILPGLEMCEKLERVASYLRSTYRTVTDNLDVTDWRYLQLRDALEIFDLAERELLSVTVLENIDSSPECSKERRIGENESKLIRLGGPSL